MSFSVTRRIVKVHVRFGNVSINVLCIIYFILLFDKLIRYCRTNTSFVVEVGTQTKATQRYTILYFENTMMIKKIVIVDKYFTVNNWMSSAAFPSACAGADACRSVTLEVN